MIFSARPGHHMNIVGVGFSRSNMAHILDSKKNMWSCSVSRQRSCMHGRAKCTATLLLYDTRWDSHAWNDPVIENLRNTKYFGMALCMYKIKTPSAVCSWWMFRVWLRTVPLYPCAPRLLHQVATKIILSSNCAACAYTLRIGIMAEHSTQFHN